MKMKLVFFRGNNNVELQDVKSIVKKRCAFFSSVYKRNIQSLEITFWEHERQLQNQSISSNVNFITFDLLIEGFTADSQVIGS
jgi:hypothetical protein